MKSFQSLLIFLTVVILSSSFAAIGEEQDNCLSQAEEILGRLQTDVVGTLSNDQRIAANTIVLDVCQDREQEVEAEKEEAVQQAREDEQEKANSWFADSPEKAGNKRLKRKSY